MLLWGGVPGKIIRFRFKNIIIQDLLKLSWWDLDIRDLKDINFKNIEVAIKEIQKIKDSYAN